MDKKYEMIMFDLGGVLVELGENPFPPEWFPDQMIQSKKWIDHPVALAFEKGEISQEEFADTIIDMYDLKVSSEELLKEFSIWIKGVFDGVHETLEILKKEYTLSILSNTNETHWDVLMNDFKLKDTVNYSFASHIIGKAKPDTGIYEFVIEKTGVKAEKILFFDDNKLNIESARKIGINAVQCAGFEEVKKYLIENKIL